MLAVFVVDFEAAVQIGLGIVFVVHDVLVLMKRDVAFVVGEGNAQLRFDETVYELRRWKLVARLVTERTGESGKRGEQGKRGREHNKRGLYSLNIFI